MAQTQKLIYQAIDEDTNKEIIRLEFTRGAMSEERMKADEAFLLPLFVQFIQNAQTQA